MSTPPFEVVKCAEISIEKFTVPEAPVRVIVASLLSTLPAGEASEPVFGVR
jgi:hypothetical protein